MADAQRNEQPDSPGQRSQVKMVVNARKAADREHAGQALTARPLMSCCGRFPLTGSRRGAEVFCGLAVQVAARAEGSCGGVVSQAKPVTVLARRAAPGRSRIHHPRDRCDDPAVQPGEQLPRSAHRYQPVSLLRGRRSSGHCLYGGGLALRVALADHWVEQRDDPVLGGLRGAGAWPPDAAGAC